MSWQNNTPENLELAKSLSREFSTIIAVGQQEYMSEAEQGYGNYDHTAHISKLRVSWAAHDSAV